MASQNHYDLNLRKQKRSDKYLCSKSKELVFDSIIKKSLKESFWINLLQIFFAAKFLQFCKSFLILQDTFFANRLDDFFQTLQVFTNNFFLQIVVSDKFFQTTHCSGSFFSGGWGGQGFRMARVVGVVPFSLE